MSTSTSSNDTSKSAYDRGEVISSHKKVSTSCDQKVKSCNNDGASNLNSNTSGNSSSDIDALSDSLGRVDIPNDNCGVDNDDDELFQDPPPKEDCPICMVPMPHAVGLCRIGKTYMQCCGKTLCYSCSIAEDDEMKQGNIKPWCACCRVPIASSKKERYQQFEKRMNMNDAEAFYTLGCHYLAGAFGLPQKKNKAISMFKRAAELGSCNARYNLGVAYRKGDGVEWDMDQALHHFKLAAIGGHESARYNVGSIEKYNGNDELAMKHFIIAARAGEDVSLKAVGHGYKAGYVTKGEYAATLRAYQVSVDEIKSDERAKAAAQRQR